MTVFYDMTSCSQVPYVMTSAPATSTQLPAPPLIFWKVHFLASFSVLAAVGMRYKFWGMTPASWVWVTGISKYYSGSNV